MNHRYDFIYLFDCADANPNGDPDAGNLPRVDTETGQGIVTDVCLKRKIRNFIVTAYERPNFQIFVREKCPLNPLIAQACTENHLDDFKTTKGWDTKKAKSRSNDEIARIQSWMCERYFDIRTFGAVMSTGPNGGQVRGPVQIAFSRSIDPVIASEHCITRLTDTDKEEGEMGRKFTVPYALYRSHGTVNPFLARQTGFTEDGDEADLEVLFTALENAFEFDASAARPAGSMAARGLLIFKHEKALGNAPAHQLFDRVKIESYSNSPSDNGRPPRAFSDYADRITFDGQPLDEFIKPGEEKDLGNGVTLIRRI